MGQLSKKNILSVMKLYCQNVVISGDTNTEKTMTVCAGVTLGDSYVFATDTVTDTVLDTPLRSANNTPIDNLTAIVPFRRFSRPAQAHVIIIIYKTCTCHEIAALLRFLVLDTDVIAITATINWTIVLTHIQNVDAVTITRFEEAQHVFYFLNKFLDRDITQVIVINRIISPDDVFCYRHFIGSNYTRCDLNKQNLVPFSDVKKSSFILKKKLND
uniref:Uncharacterized protein n=1 Tax=Strongyloides stercoralis TaxID=6248 RepID=A0AAF5DIA5_STRER